MGELVEPLIKLIKRVSVEIPNDIIDALSKARDVEEKLAKENLNVILKNVELAKKEQRPVCQDTGTPIFYVTLPKDQDQKLVEEDILVAIRKATDEIPLRHNSVNSLTGETSGNIGKGFPIVKFEQGDKLKVDLMMKGGGSENIGQIYQLPNKELNAERNMDGIKKCVLDAVFKAQGKGCPPYIIGVGIAGIQDIAMELAKKQLLRKISDESGLSNEEKDLLNKINSLGIGPLGLGGKTTALAVKMDYNNSAPASFFVTVSFFCWAARRGSYED